MTLRHMKIFVTVCSVQSITKAADKLHIAQPAVSVAVKELEKYYNIRLFDRINKRLYITDVGSKFLEYASHIISLFDDISDTVSHWEITGKLKIGASITVGTHLMPKYINDFNKISPECTINVFIGSSDIIENKILQNELDFAIIEGIVHSDNIICETFMKDRLAVVCGRLDSLCKHKTITIDQMLKHPLLLREVGSGTRELLDHALATIEYTCEPLWESTSTEALINAVCQGVGISVLPFMLVENKLKQGDLVELHVNNLHLERGIHIIYHKNKFLSHLAKDFMKMSRNLTN